MARHSCLHALAGSVQTREQQPCRPSWQDWQNRPGAAAGPAGRSWQLPVARIGKTGRSGRTDLVLQLGLHGLQGEAQVGQVQPLQSSPDSRRGDHGGLGDGQVAGSPRAEPRGYAGPGTRAEGASQQLQAGLP